MREYFFHIWVLTYMNIDDVEQELGAMQLSDSFFPIGIFTTSNGVELLFTEKKIQGVSDLINLIRVNIIQQIAPTDCVILANAFEDAKSGDLDKVIEIDSIGFATKSIKEIRDASVRSGIQLIRCVSEFVQDNEILNQYKNKLSEKKTHGIFPVAFAICCNALNIKKEKSMMMMLYGFTVGMVSAALRLGLIQHFEAQKIIHSTKPVISQSIKECSNKSILEIWQFTPQMDITQMSHEKMDSKMFIT